jgi:hypothetical protein
MFFDTYGGLCDVFFGAEIDFAVGAVLNGCW